MTWVLHYRCGGRLWPLREDGTCCTCGQLVVIPKRSTYCLARTVRLTPKGMATLRRIKT